MGECHEYRRKIESSLVFRVSWNYTKLTCSLFTCTISWLCSFIFRIRNILAKHIRTRFRNLNTLYTKLRIIFDNWSSLNTLLEIKDNIIFQLEWTNTNFLHLRNWKKWQIPIVPKILQTRKDVNFSCNSILQKKNKYRQLLYKNPIPKTDSNPSSKINFVSRCIHFTNRKEKSF